MKKNTKIRIAKCISSIGCSFAKAETNTNCLWLHYQPKEPNEIVKLRERRRKK